MERPKNPFENRLLESIHQSTVSPNLMKILPSPKEKSWPIEHRSILCPANITDEEIRLSSSISGDPEFEEQIHRRLEIYWESGVGYIPSPDGPRQIVLQSPAISSIRSGGNSTPMFSAVRRQYESPAARPANDRRRFITMRNSKAQTDVTIPPHCDFDFAKVFGNRFAYKDDAEESPEEEEFNMSLNTSIPRKLFMDDISADSSFSKEPESSEEDFIRADLDDSPRRENVGPQFCLALDLSPIKAD